MSVNSLIVAANGSVPGNILKPHNCYEAVLGWLLMAKYPSLCNVDPLSHGVEKAWLTLRSLSERYGEGAPKQLTGKWMSQNIYKQGYARVQPPLNIGSMALGDVLFMGNRATPHHSMVVAQKKGIQVSPAASTTPALLVGLTWAGTHNCGICRMQPAGIHREDSRLTMVPLNSTAFPTIRSARIFLMI